MAKDNVTPINPDDAVPEAEPVKVLGQFEGEDVTSLAISIRNAGDGLSKAVHVDPRILHRGDVVFVVLECETTKIAFKAIKDTGTLERVVDLTTLGATLVDEAVVREALDQTQKLIEEQEGLRRLPFGATDPDAPDEEGQ